jgi:hypothetical protein
VAAGEERANVGLVTKVHVPITLTLSFNTRVLPRTQGFVESCALGASATSGLGYDYIAGQRIDIVHTIKSVIGKILKMSKGTRVPKPKRGQGAAVALEYARCGSSSIYLHNCTQYIHNCTQ